MYKNIGETPLECIERYRRENQKAAELTMTYLGRLDPMAEGLLLVLAGDTTEKDQFLAMDKSYEFEVLWGFATDTYDILGIITTICQMPIRLESKMNKLLSEISKQKLQVYPPFSSKTVSGLALHVWARAGRIEEITLPTRNIKIFHLEHHDTRLISQKKLLGEIIEKIDLVHGDFRQEQIKDTWRKKIDLYGSALISKFSADVSSGTYVRSLADDMGQRLGTCALAYSIKRTRIGEYTL